MGDNSRQLSKNFIYTGMIFFIEDIDFSIFDIFTTLNNK